MPHKKLPGGKAAHSPGDGSGALASANAREWFGHFAQEIARLSGKPATFLLAVLVIGVWGICGVLFNFSDTWQLIINTGTTIATFLMVFLIQNTQNRDALAVQLKLSELILAMKGVPNRFAAIEDLSDKELEALHNESRKHAERMLEHLNRRRASRAKGKS